MNNAAVYFRETESDSLARAYPSKNRVQWVDAAKGVAILFVVLGHNPLLGKVGFEWVWAIIWLQMPMFFVIAGLFLKPNSFVGFLRSRFRVLIIPYLVACIIFLPFQLRQVNNINGVIDIFFGYLIGLGATLGQPHLWFLTALFFGMAVFFPFAHIAHYTKAKSYPLLAWLLVLFLFLLGWFFAGRIGWIFERPGQYAVVAFPWSGDISLMVAGYILFGWLAQPTLMRLNEKYPLAAAIICGLSIVLTFFIVLKFDVRLDMNRREFSHWWYWIPALSGTIGWLTFAMIVGNPVRRILAYLGERSIVIFIFHYFFETRLYSYMGRDLFASIAAFLLSIGLALAIDMLIRRIDWIALIFYPKTNIHQYLENKYK